MDEMVLEKIKLTQMDETNWLAYFDHVIEAKELYIQYGIEPSDYLIECIQKPNPNVINYSITSKDKNAIVRYTGLLLKKTIKSFMFSKNSSNRVMALKLVLLLEERIWMVPYPEKQRK